MKVSLQYGRTGLDIEVPSRRVTVVEPQFLPGLPDEAGGFREAVANPIGCPPLAELIRSHERVAIVIPDHTRPLPRERLLPWLFAALPHVPAENFVIINGTGSHRANTEAELRLMVGDAVFARYRIVNHDAFAPASLRPVGRTAEGRPVAMNRDYVDADRRIVMGFIEPYFMAGFSGGYKGIFPAVAKQTAMAACPQPFPIVVTTSPARGRREHHGSSARFRPPTVCNVIRCEQPMSAPEDAGRPARRATSRIAVRLIRDATRSSPIGSTGPVGRTRKTPPMKTPSALVLMLVAGLAGACAVDHDWIPLLNGRDLTGWKSNDETPGVFTVSDGVLKVTGGRAHLFYVGDGGRANFRNFEFKAKVMTTPGSNSGIYFHTAFRESGWPAKGFEAQVNTTHKDVKKPADSTPSRTC